MGRKGRIARLEPDIKEVIDRLIREGRATIDEIRAHLEQLGVEMPRSTLGDYRKRMTDRLQKFREAQEIAGVWAHKLADQPDSPTGQLVAEILKTIAFQTLAEMSEADAPEERATPKDLMMLAQTLNHVAGAQRKDLDYRTKIEADHKARLEAKAREAEAEVAAVAKSAGLTDEAADQIRRIVLGVVG